MAFQIIINAWQRTLNLGEKPKEGQEEIVKILVIYIRYSMPAEMCMH